MLWKQDQRYGSFILFQQILVNYKNDNFQRQLWIIFLKNVKGRIPRSDQVAKFPTYLRVLDFRIWNVL